MLVYPRETFNPPKNLLKLFNNIFNKILNLYLQGAVVLTAPI